MKTGDAKRLMIFIDETDKYHGGSLLSAIVSLLKKEGVAGASAFQGMSGFGVHGQVHTTAVVDLAASLPVTIIVVDESPVIDRVVPKLQEMITEGLMVVDEVQAIRCNSA